MGKLKQTVYKSRSGFEHAEQLFCYEANVPNLRVKIFVQTAFTLSPVIYHAPRLYRLTLTEISAVKPCKFFVLKDYLHLRYIIKFAGVWGISKLQTGKSCLISINCNQKKPCKFVLLVFMDLY